MSFIPTDTLRLTRIIGTFEQSRFHALDLVWGGGELRLSKAGLSQPGPLATEIVEVPAPRVGIFRTIPQGPSVGSAVPGGAKLGVVDVLSTLHDVVAPVAGTVTDACVADAQFVEWGAPLFRLASKPAAPLS